MLSALAINEIEECPKLGIENSHYDIKNAFDGLSLADPHLGILVNIHSQELLHMTGTRKDGHI